ncbi:TPA: AEC family transporter [Klebsiella pneumoniae]|uniref:AEC family transporter n=1 Tax=Enterobacteriaceae TaxID=543 RepID=UPI000665F1E0|nr:MULTISPECIES: AEC family transporter [Enterobacteriaceae]ECA0044432.1 AEC family transporter [Salmonella enterica subsp. enterica serovar Agona]ECL5751068.1 AEC family transporter [Salmonella enterica]EID2747851.1 AEC family transporter [Escherichia coli]EMC8603461.1 AEC family transporter [Citrobacter freundii]HCL5535269.1 AEC family transporter [Citrobacter werkmanii]
MLSTLNVVLPVFALILVGWLARKFRILGENALSELNRFVVYLALPALLFDIIANAKWSDLAQPAFISAFSVGMMVVFFLTIFIQLRRTRHLADAAIDALNASYANTGFIGFPLILVFLGHEALAPTLIATILTVSILFGIGIIIIETGLQGEVKRRIIIGRVAKSLIKNPLLMSPAIAICIPVSGLTIPGSVNVFLKLLGGAASPCALIALGLFLAGQSDKRQNNEQATVTMLVVLKLLIQPALTWLFATKVFNLSPLLVHTAVLLAALPTGTGPFMLAEFYRREASTTSKCVLFSTVVSMFTLSAYLYLIGQ